MDSRASRANPTRDVFHRNQYPHVMLNDPGTIGARKTKYRKSGQSQSSSLVKRVKSSFKRREQTGWRDATPSEKSGLLKLVQGRRWRLIKFRMRTKIGQREARRWISNGGLQSNIRLPIHIACAEGSPVEIIESILKAYPPGARMPDQRGYLPLHRICSSVSPSAGAIRCLVNAHPESVMTPDVNGDLPLHLLSQNSNADGVAMKLLCRAYPEAAMTPNRDGNLPIHNASFMCSNGAAIDVLLDVYPEGAEKLNHYGYLPLTGNAKYSSDETVVTAQESISDTSSGLTRGGFVGGKFLS